MGNTLEQWRSAIGRFNRGRATAGADHEALAWTTGDGDTSQETASLPLRLNWKLAILGLLLMCLASTCHLNLLLMSGVEPNPGPPKKAPVADDSELQQRRDTHQNVLDKLIAGSSDPNVVATLRLYDVCQSTSKIQTTLERRDRLDLETTMKYLQAPNQTAYSKKQIAVNLVLRLQNLFPDTCNICDSQYCTEINSKPLLTCVKCDQAAHHPCIAQLLGYAQDEIPYLTADDVRAKYNPHNLPGVYYICKPCADGFIPDPDAGKLQKHLKPAPASTPADPQTNSGEPLPTIAEEPDPDTPSEDEVTTPRSRGAIKNLRKSGDPNAEKADTNPLPDLLTICPEYKKGTCRHGISGKGCAFSHPKPCSRYLRHGTQKGIGCKRGASCTRFHLPLCKSSAERRECLDESCKQMHLLGTKRKKTRPICPSAETTKECTNGECNLFHPKGTKRRATKSQKATAQQIKAPGQQQLNRPDATQPADQQQAFLDQLVKTLTTSLLGALDQKIATIQTPAATTPAQQIRHPVPLQQFHHPAHQATYVPQQQYYLPPQTQAASFLNPGIGTALQTRQ